jgi:hypothetical protein
MSSARAMRCARCPRSSRTGSRAAVERAVAVGPTWAAAPDTRRRTHVGRADSGHADEGCFDPRCGVQPGRGARARRRAAAIAHARAGPHPRTGGFATTSTALPTTRRHCITLDRTNQDLRRAAVPTWVARAAAPRSVLDPRCGAQPGRGGPARGAHRARARRPHPRTGGFATTSTALPTTRRHCITRDRTNQDLRPAAVPTWVGPTADLPTKLFSILHMERSRDAGGRRAAPIAHARAGPTRAPAASRRPALLCRRFDDIASRSTAPTRTSDERLYPRGSCGVRVRTPDIRSSIADADSCQESSGEISS